MELKDKVVVITGSGSGVGRGLAVGFAKAGAKVGGISRTEADLEETKRQCEGHFEYVVGDVSNGDDVERLFSHIESTLGPVDVLINNAAVYPKVMFLDQNMDDFERALNVNVMGVARCSQRALPGMLERRFGRIVNIGSYAFLSPIPKSAVYSCSKGAVSSLTRAIAAEIDPQYYPDVLVNELMPGVFQTRMTPDFGEDPSAAFEYTKPVVMLPARGPHGQIFLKGKLNEGHQSGWKARIKRFIRRLLRLY